MIESVKFLVLEYLPMVRDVIFHVAPLCRDIIILPLLSVHCRMWNDDDATDDATDVTGFIFYFDYLAYFTEFVYCCFNLQFTGNNNVLLE